MNLLKKLFTLEFYLDVLSGKSRFRVFLASLFLAFIVSTQPSIFIVKDLYPLVQNLESKVLNLVDDVYPQELEVKIKNGTASTNVTEPYYVNIKKETLENILSNLDKKQTTFSKLRLLAIDIKGKAEDFERYQSLALLTQNSVVYYSDNKINIYPLRDIQDLTINKEIIKAKIQEINKGHVISNLLTIGVFIAPFLILLGACLFFLLAFLITTIGVYIIVKIHKLKLGFRNVFRYSAVMSFLLTFGQNLLPMIPSYTRYFGGFDKLFDIFIFGLCYLGIRVYKQKKYE